MSYKVIQYEEKDINDWDDFILKKSRNGTFLQTRKFINYHPENKFKDSSIIVKKGDEIVATILACEIIEDNNKIFYAHKGTTFGGVSIGNNVYNTSDLNEIIVTVIEFLKRNDYTKMFIKTVPTIYSNKETILLDYILYLNLFEVYKELNYYLKINIFEDSIEKTFSSSKRRDYKYSLKNNLEFKRLFNEGDISLFYSILKLTNQKLGIKEIHTLNELKKLKFEIFNEEIEFYGVFFEEKIIAGTMIFNFNNKILHTQYLVSNQDYLKLFPMDFLIYNIIKISKERRIPFVTLGISTLSLGKKLNFGLSRFKEGFGADYFLNYSYGRSL